MYQNQSVMINEGHYSLLAENGQRIAVVATINLDEEIIATVHTYHEYEETYVTELCHPHGPMGGVDKSYRLLDSVGSPAEIVRKHQQSIIDSQKESNDETSFAWELITGLSTIASDKRLQETLDTVVSPERLEPPFDIPEEKSVTKFQSTQQQNHIIKDANDTYGYANVEVKYFRGETYIIGLTEERAHTIADGCFKLKQEYKEMDMPSAMQAAGKAESLVHEAIEGIQHNEA